MTPRFSFRAEWPSLGVIAAVFALGWLLVAPWRNVPVIDDWVYAWSVEHLLKTGELRILDFSSIYPVAQVLWGALFAGAAGFSFGILRLSTVMLAAGGCWSIYLTLRELGVDAIASLLAALTVALYPVDFSLAFSFMTDVPFVALSAAALYCYVSAIVRDEPARLWWGGAVAIIAFLIRPLGLVLPLAAVAGLPLSRATVRRRLPPLATTLAVMVAFWVALPHLLGRLPVSDQRVVGLSALLDVPFRDYALWNINLPFIVAFPFAPLLLAALVQPRRAVVIGVGAVVLMIGLRLVLHQIPTPLPDWQTWSLQDFATRGGLLGGDLPPSAWSVRVMPFVKVAGAFVVSSLAVGVVTSLRRQPPAARVVIALAVGHVLLFNLLWFFNDRYYVVLAPSLAYLAVVPLAGDRRARWVAAPLLVFWGFISITGTRDMLATNAVVAGLERELEASGVPPSQIDAGYALNGWRLYAHPENLVPPHADPHYDVPFVTSATPTSYRIVNVPGPGEDVVKMVPLPAAWWQVTDRLYVVRRR